MFCRATDTNVLYSEFSIRIENEDDASDHENGYVMVLKCFSVAGEVVINCTKTCFRGLPHLVEA